DEAEELFRRALAIEEKQMGADHPNVAATLAGLGANALASGKKEEAESMLKRALAITDKAGGCGSSNGGGYSGEVWAGEAGRDGEAEAWYRRVLALEEEQLGEGHRDVAATLVLLGRCLSRGQARVEDAANLYRRALEIMEEEEGDRSLQVGVVLAL
ncbi:unnamed protein product, partial [Ectocarpus sp. 12 AP-2014]